MKVSLLGTQLGKGGIYAMDDRNKLAKFTELTHTICALTHITTRAYHGQEVFAFDTRRPYPEWFKDPFQRHFDILSRQKDPVACISMPRRYYYGIISDPPYRIVLGPVLDPSATNQTVREIAAAVVNEPAHQEVVAEMLADCPRMSVNTLLPLLLNTNSLLHFGEPQAQDDSTHEERLAPVDIAFYDYRGEAVTTYRQSSDNVFNEILQRGDIAAMREWLRDPTYAASNVPLSKDPLVNARYTFILHAAFLSITSIRGGLSRAESAALLVPAIRAMEDRETEREILALMTELSARYTEAVHERHMAVSRDALANKAMRYIERHLHTPLRTEEIAKALYVSRSYLSVTFSEQTGQPLADYIRQQKIKEARRLLVDPAFSISQISDLLCFSSQSYFTRVFKSYTGMTPKAYRDYLL